MAWALAAAATKAGAGWIGVKYGVDGLLAGGGGTPAKIKYMWLEFNVPRMGLVLSTFPAIM